MNIAWGAAAPGWRNGGGSDGGDGGRRSPRGRVVLTGSSQSHVFLHYFFNLFSLPVFVLFLFGFFLPPVFLLTVFLFGELFLKYLFGGFIATRRSLFIIIYIYIYCFRWVFCLPPCVGELFTPLLSVSFFLPACCYCYVFVFFFRWVFNYFVFVW